MTEGRTGQLARCEKRTVEHTGEEIHWLWVVGPEGMVSTWFSGAEVLGHSVCSGAVVHSPREREGWEAQGPCEFLESECWAWFGSSLWLEPIVAAYDAGQLGAVWEWLGEHYGLLTTP